MAGVHGRAVAPARAARTGDEADGRPLRPRRVPRRAAARRRDPGELGRGRRDARPRAAEKALMERFAGRYGLLKQLGKGGMGEVSLAVDLDTGAEYALKRLTVQDAAENAELIRGEFEALSHVRHPA